MSPTVLRDGPFRRFSFSCEEQRMHVHVAHPDGEAKFWLEPSIELAAVVGLSPRTVGEADAVVRRHEREVRDAWKRATLAVEITHVSKHGFWLLLDTSEELLVRFTDFPWFRQATNDQLLDVERPTADHLSWPQLDVDLSVQSVREPSAFPLVARARRVAEGS